LSGDDVGIIVWMNELEAGFLLKLMGSYGGLIVGVAEKFHIGP
jgi:hypothetical protein